MTPPASTSFDPPFPDTSTPARPLQARPQSQFRRVRHDPFADRPFKSVPPDGPIPARIYLIGERPAENEARRGRPFVGISGQYLSTFLSIANIERSACRINNLVSTFSSHAKPTAEEIARDHDALAADIAACDPDVIGLIGGWSVEHVLMRPAEMERTHGCPVWVPSLFGGELPRERGWVCLPILHPANCVHSPESAPNVLDDFLRLGQLLDGEMTVREDDPYAGREQYIDYDGDGELVIDMPAGVDTEGKRDAPWCSTLSTQAGTSILVKPHQRVRFTNKVWLHNSLWDLGVLRAMGVELAEDQFRDTMILAYNLCIEPQGLKALLYRHCNMQQDDYADILREASRDKALEYLCEVMTREWPEIEPFIVFGGGKARVKKPWGIGRRVEKIVTDVWSDKRDKDDNPTDPRKRWREIDDYVREPVEELLGPMTVATLDDIPYEKARHYSCRDSDGELRLAPILEARVREMGLEEIARIDHAVIPMLDRMQTVGMKLAPKKFWDDLELKCEAQEERARHAIWKETGWDLNPMSGDQVAALLYGETREQLIAKGVPADEITAAGLGLTPPKMTDGGKTGKVRGSTNDKCLENLLPQSPIVEHIMDFRQANKVKGTYVRPLRKLALTGDGRAHPGIKPTRVNSGRLATADPNLLAIPVHWGIGTEVRGGFIADDGYVFYDADLSQAEMRCMASDSKDEKLCKIFWNKQDVHTMTASDMFSSKPEAIEDWMRYAAKQVGFGIINLISEWGLYDQLILYRAHKKDGSRWSLQDCADMLEAWFGIYKGVKRYHNDVIEEARQTGLSRESIGGRIRYVPGVWSPIGKIRGDSEREACSHRIQSMAQSYMKKAMALMWPELKALDGVDAVLQLHDEIVVRVPDDTDTKSTVDCIVTWAMENAHKLRVPMLAEGGFGANWIEAKQ